MHIVRDQLSVRLEESNWARKAGVVMVPLTLVAMAVSIIGGVMSGIRPIAILLPLFLVLPFLIGLSFLRRGRRTIVIDGATLEFRESWGPGTPTRVISASQVSKLRYVIAPFSRLRQGLTVHYVELVPDDGPSIRLDSYQLLSQREVKTVAEDISRLLGVPLDEFDGRG